MSLNKRIIIPQDSGGLNPEEHFDIKTYNGNSSSRSITGVGFQPDLIYTFTRNAAEHPNITDSVRGTNSQLLTSLSNTAYSRTDMVTSFDSDGYGLGADSSQWINHTGRTYVGFCFKGGGNSNTYNVDGTGYSTKSAAGLADDGDLLLNGASVNTVAGFGIYKINPSLAVGETNSFEHGLNAAPELVITKNVSVATRWWTFTDAVDGSWDYVRLNEDNTASNDTFTSGEVADDTYIRANRTFYSTSNNAMIYAFHSVDGFSKVGKYTGGSSSEISTGFKPRFLMVKSTTSQQDWHLFNSETGGGDTFDEFVKPNVAAAEASASNREVTFTDNGFEWTAATSNAVNTSGNTYIYLAIA